MLLASVFDCGRITDNPEVMPKLSNRLKLIYEIRSSLHALGMGTRSISGPISTPFVWADITMSPPRVNSSSLPASAIGRRCATGASREASTATYRPSHSLAPAPFPSTLPPSRPLHREDGIWRTQPALHSPARLPVL